MKLFHLITHLHICIAINHLVIENVKMIISVFVPGYPHILKTGTHKFSIFQCFLMNVSQVPLII
jgi:hypothetical protein